MCMCIAAGWHDGLKKVSAELACYQLLQRVGCLLPPTHTRLAPMLLMSTPTHLWGSSIRELLCKLDVVFQQQLCCRRDAALPHAAFELCLCQLSAAQTVCWLSSGLHGESLVTITPLKATTKLPW